MADVPPLPAGVSCCGSSRALTRSPTSLPTSRRWSARVRAAAARVVDAQRSSFDFVLLDTPPGLGNLSGMAMLAADGLLIPALAADLDVRGAGKLYDLVESRAPGSADPGGVDRGERAALAGDQGRCRADARG